MSGPAPAPIRLTEHEHDILRAIVRRRSAPQHIVLRARILIAAHECLGVAETARRLSVVVSTVRAWRQRWLADAGRRAAEAPERLPALIEQCLSDAARPGAPPTFSAEQVAQIIALGLRPPSDFDRPVTHWTPNELASEAVKQGIVASISPRTVGRFLK